MTRNLLANASLPTEKIIQCYERPLAAGILRSYAIPVHNSCVCGRRDRATAPNYSNSLPRLAHRTCRARQQGGEAAQRRSSSPARDVCSPLQQMTAYDGRTARGEAAAWQRFQRQTCSRSVLSATRSAGSHLGLSRPGLS